jgi:hypothetical protein
MGNEGRRHQAGRKWKVKATRDGGGKPLVEQAARKGAGRKEGSRERRSRGDMQAEGRAAGRDEGAGRDGGAGRNESGRQSN